MNIFLEIFGYIGTVLVVGSMLMTSVAKLRIVNICGSAIAAIYSLIIGTYPILIMNVAIVIIKTVQLVILCRKKKAQAKGES